ncbi:MAG TPA: alpha/beta fold hydrolase [Candidatus Hydrogenedentes bacterium]|nr:alpha/beta fold hydrolase [Candidatus Hydrogenedentota bacterium]
MFWDNIFDKRVTRYDDKTPRDPETGIMEGAAPRTLGPENTDKAILFVHGFSGTPNNFHDLPDQVAEAGWRVRVMLLPGHGTSPREFEKTSAEQLRQGVADELAPLRERYKTVVLVGHSMGGALATLTTAEVLEFLEMVKRTSLY